MAPDIPSEIIIVDVNINKVNNLNKDNIIKFYNDKIKYKIKYKLSRKKNKKTNSKSRSRKRR